jgi:hypothetical protein
MRMGGSLRRARSDPGALDYEIIPLSVLTNVHGPEPDRERMTSVDAPDKKVRFDAMVVHST